MFFDVESKNNQNSGISNLTGPARGGVWWRTAAYHICGATRHPRPVVPPREREFGLLTKAHKIVFTYIYGAFCTITAEFEIHARA